MNSRPTLISLWLLVLVVAGFAVYASGLDIAYFGDDFGFVFDQTAPGPLYYFFHNNPGDVGFRPVRRAILRLSQEYYGLDTRPVHILQLSMHVLLAWLVLVSMLGLGFSNTQAVVGSLFMLLSQANVHAVLSNDTLSQVSGTLFGCVSLWLMYRYLYQPRSPMKISRFIRDRDYYLSLLALTISLLSNETSLAFVPMLIVIVIAATLTAESRSRLVRLMIWECSPILIVALVYLLVRSAAGGVPPHFGSGNYDLHFGSNVFKNLILLVFSAVIPASSVTAFTTLETGHLGSFLLIAGATVLFVLSIAYGLWLARQQYRVLFVLGAFFVLGLMPTAVLNHVSELYVYNSMPFACVIFGAALGKWLESAELFRGARAALLLAVGLLLASHALAVQQKAQLMKLNGDRATSILNQITAYMDRVPAHGNLLLVNPPATEVEYSVFLINGFNVLEYGLQRINQISGRNDFSAAIVDKSEFDAKAITASGPYLALTLNGDLVQIYQAGQH